ncbi:hypothetical protein [Pseudoroseicyclus sp. CXY001]|uniref:hypothetical protein n=1 Tax=Pseudoroseicyclus sp. CXY001 TaxID=3242492 RepID=UPI0035716132
MFRLNLTNTEARVELLHGAALHCIPLDREMVIQAMDDAASTKEAPDNSVRPSTRPAAWVVLLAERTICGWSGIGDLAGEEEQPFDAALIPQLMKDAVVWQSFVTQYVSPYLQVIEEGNVSTASRNGTSGAGKNTAGAARRGAKSARSAPRQRKASKGA